MEIIFHSHANKTHFHKKGCAPSLILKVRVFGTRKWPIKCGWLIYCFCLVVFSGPPEKKMGIKASNTAEVSALKTAFIRILRKFPCIQMIRSLCKERHFYSLLFGQALPNI